MLRWAVRGGPVEAAAHFALAHHFSMISARVSERRRGRLLAALASFADPCRAKRTEITASNTAREAGDVYDATPSRSLDDRAADEHEPPEPRRVRRPS